MKDSEKHHTKHILPAVLKKKATLQESDGQLLDWS